MRDLNNHFLPVNEIPIIDKETNIEKYLIETDLPDLENKEVVSLTVAGKTRRAMIWKRKAEKDFNPEFFNGVEIKKGQDLTWLHLFPEVKATKFDATMKTPVTA